MNLKNDDPCFVKSDDISKRFILNIPGRISYNRRKKNYCTKEMRKIYPECTAFQRY